MTTEKAPASYNPAIIESKWYRFWQEKGYFTPAKGNKYYSIVIPPPNVTGSLHMGHGFQQTLMDALIRYHRLQGYATLWQPGTDHAGIATQMVVEKQLLQDNIRKNDLSRPAFIEKVHEWKAVSGGRISQQIKRLGASLDWSRDKFTLDEGLSKAVTEVFVSLFREKLIYQGEKLINWDPILQTAISDLEVQNEQVTGKIWQIKYQLENESHITIATTRPETLFGDMAIAVHPKDQRFQHLIGKQAFIPISNRAIPIIADEYVDQEFGTGCVKITPAHDFNDYAIAQRHNIKALNILTEKATLNENTPVEYQGLSCKEARKKIVQELQDKQYLVSESKHISAVPKGDRSGATIEPMLTKQWFVKTKELAKPAIQAVKQGDIKFYPSNWENTYFHWMNNIEDWCISRQLWWGHRIPAWYDDKNNIYVGYSLEEVREFYNLAEDINLTQDEDVLDTWFSSALWPFTALDWPDKSDIFDHFFPTSTLVTGFDIIFFWVARMIMFSLKFTGKIPFKDIVVTGLIRDSKGHKMSKSKGNVIDPIDLIDGISLLDLKNKRTNNMMQPQLASKILSQTKVEFPNGIDAYGCDALRFTFCALAITGRDIRFDMSRLLGYRNFCNKIWHATNFVLANCSSNNYDKKPKSSEHDIFTAWILDRLQQTIGKTIIHYQSYRFDLLAQELHDFIWHEYCSWFIEFSKQIKQKNDLASKSNYTVEWSLLFVLKQSLIMLHPLMPFITEELWSKISNKFSGNYPSILDMQYPEHISNINLENHATVLSIKEFIDKVRALKGENNISPNKTITIYVVSNLEQKKLVVYENLSLLNSMTKSEIKILDDHTQIPDKSTKIVVDELELFIPMSDIFDFDKEINRLTKQLSSQKIEHDKLSAKLNNPGFCDNAPTEVVAKERLRLKTIQDSIEKLTEQQQKLTS